MALNRPLLSILIATMPSRRKMLIDLTMQLSLQMKRRAKLMGGFEDVEVLFDESMDYNVGKKRNYLLGLSKGTYIVFIDDDDYPSNRYVELICQACLENTDCIGIKGSITTNRGPVVKWEISKDFGWPWFTKNGVHYRTPNHISPVKRELALQAGFPEISFGEDAEYSRRLLPLLKTETKIEEELYYYDYISDKANHEKYRTS